MAERPVGLSPCDFIYCGRRVIKDAKLGIAIRLILEGGVLSEERLWACPARHNRFVIGGVYTGAEFSDKQSFGLDSAKYVKVVDRNDVMLWQAKDEQANIEVKSLRLEADHKKLNSIDLSMHNLRVYYNNLTGYGDKTAFEQAVLRALRKPLTKKEQRHATPEH